jgi:hypothetical protein
MENLIYAQLAILILEKALPAIQEQVKKGQIPVEKQQEVLDKLNKLRSVETGFTGPEWQVS